MTQWRWSTHRRKSKLQIPIKPHISHLLKSIPDNLILMCNNMNNWCHMNSFLHNIDCIIPSSSRNPWWPSSLEKTDWEVHEQDEQNEGTKLKQKSTNRKESSPKEYQETQLYHIPIGTIAGEWWFHLHTIQGACHMWMAIVRYYIVNSTAVYSIGFLDHVIPLWCSSFERMIWCGMIYVVKLLVVASFWNTGRQRICFVTTPSDDPS